MKIIDRIKKYLTSEFFTRVDSGLRIRDGYAIKYVLEGDEKVEEEITKMKNGESKFEKLMVHRSAINSASVMYFTSKNPDEALTRLKRFEDNVEVVEPVEKSIF